jgi:hypothetical protein
MTALSALAMIVCSARQNRGDRALSAHTVVLVNKVARASFE